MIAAFVLAVLTAAPSAPAFAGITLGEAVSQVIGERGNPTVVNTDVGTVWTWEKPDGKLRLTSDNDGKVVMIDIAPSAQSDPSFAVPAPGHKQVAFNATRADMAKKELAPFADFTANTAFPESGAPATLQAYRLDTVHELALLFDAGSKTLREGFYGEQPALARAGLLPEIAQTLPAFQAPILTKLGGADYNSQAQGVGYVRIAVNADGSVGGATMYVTSGNATLDRVAITSAMHDEFTPAQRGGLPVASVYFYREDFVTTKSP
ncbi:MAG: energy transducer TonB [Vulcanimicrobiaceae bacterium]